MSPIQLQGADSAKDRPIQLADAGRKRVKRFTGDSDGTTWLTVGAPVSSTWEIQQILVSNFDVIVHTIEMRITDTASAVYTFNPSTIAVGFAGPVPIKVFTAADQPLDRRKRVLGPGEVLEMRLGEAISFFQDQWRIDYFETLGTA
ncbi:MAG: hypothetical protein V3V08_23325 [Nannocystaceae bacterium]